MITLWSAGDGGGQWRRWFVVIVAVCVRGLSLSYVAVHRSLARVPCFSCEKRRGGQGTCYSPLPCPLTNVLHLLLMWTETTTGIVTVSMMWYVCCRAKSSSSCQNGACFCCCCHPSLSFHLFGW